MKAKYNLKSSSKYLLLFCCESYWCFTPPGASLGGLSPQRILVPPILNTCPMKELHTAMPRPASPGSSSLTDPHHRVQDDFISSILPLTTYNIPSPFFHIIFFRTVHTISTTNSQSSSLQNVGAMPGPCGGGL